MTRLPLFALTLIASAAALPAAAQETVVDGEKINQVIVYGEDKCEQSSPDEIVVCSRLPETERYRVPQIFRGGSPLDPRSAPMKPTNCVTMISGPGVVSAMPSPSSISPGASQPKFCTASWAT